MKDVTVYLLGLSDPVSSSSAATYRQMPQSCKDAGMDWLHIEVSPLLGQNVSPAKKGEDFNQALYSGRYDWIVDVSGGDLANLSLPYLDYEAYANSSTMYAAYSDGSSIVNALARASHKKALLFPFWIAPNTFVAFLAGAVQPLDLCALFGKEPGSLPVCGGNIRCVLKLAATPWQPVFDGRILILESLSAKWTGFCSMCAHYAQMGAFEQAAGVVIGRFSRLEREDPAIYEKMKAFLEELTQGSVPVEVCPWIGHEADVQPVWIDAMPDAGVQPEEENA